MKNIAAPAVKQTHCVVLAAVHRLGSPESTNEMAVIQLSSLAGSSSTLTGRKKANYVVIWVHGPLQRHFVPLFPYCLREEEAAVQC